MQSVSRCLGVACSAGVRGMDAEPEAYMYGPPRVCKGEVPGGTRQESVADMYPASVSERFAPGP